LPISNPITNTTAEMDATMARLVESGPSDSLTVIPAAWIEAGASAACAAASARATFCTIVGVGRGVGLDVGVGDGVNVGV
jgi:hypothetical protein